MAGPAGHPAIALARKLGIKEGMRVVLVDAPAGFEALLDPLPDDVTLRRRLGPAELLVAFVTKQRRLAARLSGLLGALPNDGTLWIAWPKRASRVPTDMTDHVARRLLLPLGWVDTKVCALDETWSGLRFVRRRDRR